MKEPIFILWARSFWLGILPLFVVMTDIVMSMFSMLMDTNVNVPMALAIATVVNFAGSLFGHGQVVDPALVEEGMLKLAPLFGLIVAHQRSGAARPYSLNPAYAK